jgi:hypothetical protein
LATLEIATGKVVAHVRDRRTTVDFLSFMDDVVKSYPVSALHVVLDNLNIHKRTCFNSDPQFNVPIQKLECPSAIAL